MKNTTKRTYITIALIAAFFVGVILLFASFVVHGATWASSRVNGHIYQGGQLTIAGTIYDRNGDPLVKTVDGERVFSDDYYKRVSNLHVVGDSQGYISTGIQTVYRSDLIGYTFAGGLYSSIRSDEGCDINLTIDSEVSSAAYQAMNGKKGTVVVYNYKTGEIICMVSAPSYDPNNKPSDIDSDSTGKYDGIYLNRAISGVFTPGSTFKIVTAICAIENIPDIYSRTFKCTGKYDTGSGEVICNDVHGTVDFERALNVSCNSVFAELADELGTQKLTATVRELGFGKNITINDITTVRSTFDVGGATKLDLGWAGIGQFTTLINPCQELLLMGAIANGGTAITPRLVESSSSIFPTKGSVSKNITLSSDVAKKIKALMRSNVVNYYGDGKFPNLEMCGKTGSAEVENKKSHAWFVGFSQKSSFPYAIVVCLENGGIGYYDAIPVANKTLQALYAQ